PQRAVGHGEVIARQVELRVAGLRKEDLVRVGNRDVAPGGDHLPNISPHPAPAVARCIPCGPCHPWPRCIPCGPCNPRPAPIRGLPRNPWPDPIRDLPYNPRQRSTRIPDRGERMTPLRIAAAAGLLAAALSARCGSAPAAKGLHPTPPGLGRYPYSDADVEFMSGMIPHHAQAVIMAGWAPSHGARKDVA